MSVTLGLEQAGFEVLYANDISKDATDTYKANLHAGIVDCKNVARVNPHKLREKINRPVDIIVAGTPCQEFSTLGKRNPCDPRNAMFKHLARFLKAFKPKMFLMENVDGMLTMRGGTDFGRICEKLGGVGYATTLVNLLASEYGVPQNRERVFLIGTLGGREGREAPEARKREERCTRDHLGSRFSGPKRRAVDVHEVLLPCLPEEDARWVLRPAQPRGAAPLWEDRGEIRLDPGWLWLE